MAGIRRKKTNGARSVLGREEKRRMLMTGRVSLKFDTTAMNANRFHPVSADISVIKFRRDVRWINRRESESRSVGLIARALTRYANFIRMNV